MRVLIEVATGSQWDGHWTAPSNNPVKIFFSRRIGDWTRGYKLGTPKDDFEGNSLGKFLIDIEEDIQEINQVRLEIPHDTRDAWYVLYVVVKPFHAARRVFGFGRWFSQFDHSIESMAHNDGAFYELSIQTGGVLNAGTNSKMDVQLVNEDGQTTNWERLDHQYNDDFRSRGLDKYLIRHVDEEFGRIIGVNIQKGREGKSPNWFVENINIRNLQTGENTFIHERKWYNSGHHEFRKSDDEIYVMHIHWIHCRQTDTIGTSDDVKLRVFVDPEGDPNDPELNSPTYFTERAINDQGYIFVGRRFLYKNGVYLRLRDYRHDNRTLITSTIDSKTPIEHASVNKFGSGGGNLFEILDYDYEIVYSIYKYDIEKGPLKLRNQFSKVGKGSLSDDAFSKLKDASIYRIFNEKIGVRKIWNKHARQAKKGENYTSVKEWIADHCNFWSTRTIHENKAKAKDWEKVLETDLNWLDVNGENSRDIELSGFQMLSKQTHIDNPGTHRTYDWNYELFPSPQYNYLFGEGMKHTKLEKGDLLPFLHNETETASFPIAFRPFRGEHTTAIGRYIWDVGHLPVSAEIHPSHTIIRERATTASIGDNETRVPVNEAMIGLCALGGFPKNSRSRWESEFPGFYERILEGRLSDDEALNQSFYYSSGIISDLWPTNLKKRKTSFKFYPPVKKPGGAELTFSVKNAKCIVANDLMGMVDFATHCSSGFGFLEWGDIGMQEGGLTVQAVPDDFEPMFTPQLNKSGQISHYLVEVDLAEMDGIPIAYVADIQCGWSCEDTRINKYEITFEKLIFNEDSADEEWRLFFGVNGQWQKFITNDLEGFRDPDIGLHVELDRTSTIYTYDDLPISIQSVGIEADSDLNVNNNVPHAELINYGANPPDNLARINIQLSGDTPFESLRNLNLNLLNIIGNKATFQLKAKGGDTYIKYSLIITIKKVN